MDKETIEKIALHLLQSISLEVGKVSIQDLTGHFSQLLADLRKMFNSSKEIKGLLLKYPEMFTMKKELVSKFPERELRGSFNAPSTRVISPQLNVEADYDESSETEDDDEEVEEEEDYEQVAGNPKISIDGKGKVIRTFEKYAFLEYCSSNYTTTVYFDVRTFENGQHTSLKDLKLEEEVYFHAVPSVGHAVPYRATKVWRSGCRPSSRNTRKCYSSSTSLASQDSSQSEDLDGTKVAQIMENYRLIRAMKETLENDLLNPSKRELQSLQKARNLDDFLEIEDFVYFSAIRSGKKNTVEEVKTFETPLETVKHRTKKRKNKKIIGSVSNTDCRAHSLGETDGGNPHSNNSDGKCRALYDLVGKIYDVAGKESVIYFGKNKKAIVLPNRVYKNGNLVGDLGWELDEETEVQFDAMYYNGNWWAVLVWIGEKPYRKNDVHSKEDLEQEICKASLHDEEHSSSIRRYRSYPHLGTNSPNNPLDESLKPTKNKPKEAKSSKAKNYSKVHRDNNSKKT